MSDWWRQPDTDWTTGEPLRLVQLLAVAYPARSDVQRVLQAIGTAWDGAPGDAVGEALWRWAVSGVAEADKTLDLAASVLSDPGAAVFHAPLRMLLGPQLGRLVQRWGLPPEAEAETLDALASAPSELTDRPIEGFQALTSPGAELEDSRAHVRGLLAAFGRTAMIERNGVPVGTGVLIGDDLLLTAGHVLGLAPWPPAGVDGFTAAFDYYDEGRAPAETGSRVHVTGLLAESPPTTLESENAASARWNAVAEELDYALLKLERPVGAEISTDSQSTPRGFYSIVSDEYDFSRSPLLMIVQYPLGQFQKITRSPGAAQVNGNRTRIRYGGITLPGSSGSPVIDHRGRLVALHHYSTLSRNQGVIMSSICRAIVGRLGQGVFAPSAAPVRPVPAVAAPVIPDPYVVKVLNGQPFANRTTLRSEVRAMCLPGGRRTLVIAGEVESGVSTSYKYMAHIAAVSRSHPGVIPSSPVGGLKVIPIDLREYRNRSVGEWRASIMEHLCMHVPGAIGDALAQAARDIATFKHWWMIYLPADTQHWVFIDSVDSATEVVQSGLDELIRALAGLAMDPQIPVWMVLAGRHASVVAQRSGLDFAGQDRAAGLSRVDVRDWVRERAGEELRTVHENILESKLDALFLAGANPSLRPLALKLPALYLEVTT